MAVQKLELSGREGIHSVIGYPTVETPIRPIVFEPHHQTRGIEAAFRRWDLAHAPKKPHSHH